MHVLVIEHWFKEEDADTTTNPVQKQGGWEEKREGSWHSIFSCWSSRINAPASRRVHRTFDFLFWPTQTGQSQTFLLSIQQISSMYRTILPRSYSRPFFNRLFSSLHLGSRVSWYFLFLFVPRLQFFAHVRKWIVKREKVNHKHQIGRQINCQDAIIAFQLFAKIISVSGYYFKITSDGLARRCCIVRIIFWFSPLNHSSNLDTIAGHTV